MSISRLRWLWP